MRIGAVSYLNTKPLVYRLTELAPEHELIFDLPSRLADNLAAGHLDVALIPSIEFFQRDDYQIVSDACIACRGPVRSVKLFSRVEPTKIRTLALDEGSRTSVALVQILLKDHYQVSPELRPFPIEAEPQAIAADALLMIGDRAMRFQGDPFVAELDLGEAWCDWMDLPFVFAMWVAKKPADNATEDELIDLASALSRARDFGCANLDEIARENKTAGLAYPDRLSYLRDNLHFTLGQREIYSLSQFNGAANNLGLAPPVHAFSTILGKNQQNPRTGWTFHPDLRAAR
jgi:chorismate dehydratase